MSKQFKANNSRNLRIGNKINLPLTKKINIPIPGSFDSENLDLKKTEIIKSSERYLGTDLDDSENKEIYKRVTEKINTNSLPLFQEIFINNANLANSQQYKIRGISLGNINNKNQNSRNNRNSGTFKEKTIEKGGFYNNVQVTYVKYSKNPNAKFNFPNPEPQTISVERKNNLTKEKTAEKRSSSTFKSSCDNLKIIPKIDTANNIAIVEIYQHFRGKSTNHYSKSLVLDNKRNKDLPSNISVVKTDINLESSDNLRCSQKLNSSRFNTNTTNNYLLKNEDNLRKLKHYFCKYRDIIKNMKNNDNNDLYKNLDYIGWFIRHKNNNGIPNNILTDKANSYLKEDFTNNNIEMPYEEWFDRHCENKKNFLKSQNEKEKIESEKKYKLLLNNYLKNILGENNDNYYTIEQMNYLKKCLTKLTEEDQKESLSILKNNCCNDNQIKQLNIVKMFIDKYNKKNGIKKITENSVNIYEQKYLKKIDDFWNLDTNDLDCDFIYSLLKEMDKENFLININDLFLENSRNTIDNLANILSRFDANTVSETIDFLLQNNPEKIQKIIKLNSLINEELKRNKLKKILCLDNNKKRNIKYIVNILNILPKNRKQSLLNYMQTTDEDDFNHIISELPSNEEINDYDYFNDSIDKIYNDFFKIKDYYNFPNEIKMDDDEIYELIAEMIYYNEYDNEKKVLDEDEFDDFINNILKNIFKTDNSKYQNTKFFNDIKNLHKSDQIKVLKILKENANNDRKLNIFNDLYNKIKNYLINLKHIEAILNKNIYEKEMLYINNDMILDKNDAKYLINEFSKDIFEYEKNPLSRKELREQILDKNLKIKIIAILLKDLNLNDQSFIIGSLSKRVNDDYQKYQLQKLTKILYKMNNMKIFLSKNKVPEAIEITAFKTLSNKELQNLITTTTVTVFSLSFNENKLNHVVDKINTLPKEQKIKVLNEIKKKAQEVNQLYKYEKIMNKINENLYKNGKNLNLKDAKNNNIKTNDVDIEKIDLNKAYNIYVIKNGEELNEIDFNKLLEKTSSALFKKENIDKEKNNVEKYKKYKEYYYQLDELANEINKLNNDGKDEILLNLKNKITTENDLKNYEIFIKIVEKNNNQRKKEITKAMKCIAEKNENSSSIEKTGKEQKDNREYDNILKLNNGYLKNRKIF